MSASLVKAEPFFRSQNVLGEGILWDSDAQVLRWVDIKVAEVHSLNPVTGSYVVDRYPETQFVTALAMRPASPGTLIGLTQDAVAILAVSTPDEASSTLPDGNRNDQKILKVIARPLTDLTAENIEMRFNDGGCDPRGRMFAGSTNHSPVEGFRGEFVRVLADGSSEQIFSEISCSNGLGWSPDHKTMYYIDSGVDEIRAFDYDISTGTLSNKRIFAPSPSPLEGTETKGCYDGMTIDGVGNVWAARWNDSRVMGFRPDGSVIVNISTPGCLLPTIPCFGGPNLDTMYIASANTQWAGQGDVQALYPHSGDILRVDFSPGSEMRKLLGEWKGAERYRFSQ